MDDDEDINNDPFLIARTNDPQAQALMQQSLQNVDLLNQRDQEIDKIVRSIEQLNSIFKDVTTLIHDQGTVLDRIDHNVAQSAIRVEQAHKSLVKAEKLQKSNRKMMVIFVLTCVVVFLTVLLIIVKFSG